jgi:site-specific DNA-cytosine methylase
LQFTRAYLRQGGRSVGYTEKDRVVAKGAHALVPYAKDYGDYFAGGWKCLKRGMARVLAAGPPCTPFSAAGKQRGLEDPGAQLLLAVADIAGHLQPDMVDIEETPSVATLDGGAALLALDELMLSNGYHRTPYIAGSPLGVETVCPWLLRATAEVRPRAILHYERADILKDIGEACGAIPIGQGPSLPLSKFLVDLTDVDDVLWAEGTFRPAAHSAHGRGTPWVVGHLHFGGPQERVQTGSLVRFADNEDTWRVLDRHDGVLTVLSRSRQAPRRATRRVEEVKKHLKQRRQVYNPGGPTYAVKAWGEPPEGPGGVLILDARRGPFAVRSLAPRECWRLQGFSDGDAETFQAQSPGCTYDWHRMAGNSIHTAYADAVANRTLSRLRRVDQRRAERKANDLRESGVAGPPGHVQERDSAGGGPRREGAARGRYVAATGDDRAARDAVGMLMSQSLAPLTKKTYGSAQRQWMDWREQRGETPLLERSVGPAVWENELMEHYAFFGVVRGLAWSTLNTRLYAIKRLHLDNGIHVDLTAMTHLKTIMRGLKNMQGGAVRKLAVTKSVLLDVHLHGGLDPAIWDDALTETAILTGFFFLLRSCEYLKTEHGVDAEKCLRMEHVTFYRNGKIINGSNAGIRADRMVILVPYSKTDAMGVGVELDLDADEGNPLCPVEAFNRLRSLDARRFHTSNATKQLFALADGRTLSKGRVHDVLKAAGARLGYDPKDFTSHSLRAGGASAMFHNGFSVEEIKKRGRWVSDSWKVYVQGLSDKPCHMTRRMTASETLLRPQRRKTQT